MLRGTAITLLCWLDVDARLNTPPIFQCFLLKFRAASDVVPNHFSCSPGTSSTRRCSTPATKGTPTLTLPDTRRSLRMAKKQPTPGPLPGPRVTTRSCIQVHHQWDTSEACVRACVVVVVAVRCFWFPCSPCKKRTFCGKEERQSHGL